MERERKRKRITCGLCKRRVKPDPDNPAMPRAHTHKRTGLPCRCAPPTYQLRTKDSRIRSELVWLSQRDSDTIAKLARDLGLLTADSRVTMGASHLLRKLAELYREIPSPSSAVLRARVDAPVLTRYAREVMDVPDDRGTIGLLIAWAAHHASYYRTEVFDSDQAQTA